MSSSEYRAVSDFELQSDHREMENNGGQGSAYGGTDRFEQTRREVSMISNGVPYTAEVGFSKSETKSSYLFLVLSKRRVLIVIPHKFTYKD
jgi:hypothetical protein